MPQVAQIFAGALGELWEETGRYLGGESAAFSFLERKAEIGNTVCDELQITFDEFLWVIAFLSAGPAVSGPSSPPAAAPSPAGRGSWPHGMQQDVITTMVRPGGVEMTVELPQSGYEGQDVAP